MYADGVEFHALSETEQRRLVHNRQVATNDGLVTEIPDETVPVRVFTQSIETLLLDKLEEGRFSIAELADWFGVDDQAIRRIINKFRRRGQDSFTGENRKFNLITDRQGIVRVKETRGTSYYYTVETIPYFARVVDPTLGFSLLGLADRVASLPRLVEHVPGGKATKLDEEYAIVVGEYWGMKPQEVFDYVTEYDREYVKTSLLPLPIVDADAEYEQVGERFVESDGVYKRVRIGRDEVEQLVSKFQRRVSASQAGIRLYQAHILDLADIQWYARQERPDLLPVIDDGIGALIDGLEPDSESKGTEHAATPSEEPTEQMVKDQLRLALDETPQTAQEIHEQLSPETRALLSVEEVTTQLEKYARTGYIDRNDEGDTTRYCAASGLS